MLGTNHFQMYKNANINMAEDNHLGLKMPAFFQIPVSEKETRL